MVNAYSVTGLNLLFTSEPRAIGSKLPRGVEEEVGRPCKWRRQV
jgi:hypothetical protein